MFTAENPTVFILGAGASWHYGYPTGEDLVKRVQEKAKIVQKYFEYMDGNPSRGAPLFFEENKLENETIDERWQRIIRECRELQEGLEAVNPLVIDYYLGWNEHLEKIGKLLISLVILECQHEFQAKKGNVNNTPATIRTSNGERPKELSEFNDKWCRFIVHQLAMHCEQSSDLHKNAAWFVTFNYDTSLEQTLRSGLKHIKKFDKADIDHFLNDSRITHIYGRVHQKSRDSSALNWMAKDFKTEDHWQTTRDFTGLLNAEYEASKEIQVIDPAKKTINEKDLEITHSRIQKAKHVYILGYGFDKHNSEKLRLPEFLYLNPPADKKIYFTNFGDINQVNKRASKIFFRDPSCFPPGGPSVVKGRYEKSTRNVYDALQLDFDMPESKPLT
jgi:hypothetical protein